MYPSRSCDPNMHFFSATIFATLVSTSCAAILGSRRAFSVQDGFLSPSQLAGSYPNFASSVLGAPGLASGGYGTPGFGGAPLPGSSSLSSPSFGALDTALRGVASAPVAVAGPGGASAPGVSAGPGGASANGITAVAGVPLAVPGSTTFGRTAAL